MSAVVVVSVITAMILTSILRAYVIAQLWSWFIVSALNVPEISMTTAFGFSLLAGLFTNSPTPKSDGRETGEQVSDLVGAFLGVLLKYAFALVLGTVVHGMTSNP